MTAPYQSRPLRKLLFLIEQNTKGKISTLRFTNLRNVRVVVRFEGLSEYSSRRVTPAHRETLSFVELSPQCERADPSPAPHAQPPF